MLDKIFEENNDKRYIMFGTEEAINKVKDKIGTTNKIIYYTISKDVNSKYLQIDEKQVYLIEDKSYYKIIMPEYDNKFK